LTLPGAGGGGDVGRHHFVNSQTASGHRFPTVRRRSSRQHSRVTSPPEPRRHSRTPDTTTRAALPSGSRRWCCATFRLHATEPRVNPDVAAETTSSERSRTR
jgi:hypothetical protein